jgi:hypothetical protein
MRGGSTYSASVSTMPASRSSTDLAAGPRSTIHLAEQKIELQAGSHSHEAIVSLTVRIDSETVNDVMSSLGEDEKRKEDHELLPENAS